MITYLTLVFKTTYKNYIYKSETNKSNTPPRKIHTMNLKKLLPAVLASFGLVLANSQATLIIYDGFNYPNNTTDPDPDGGVNGGNGIAFNSTGNITSTGLRNTWYGTSTNVGLTYTGLQTTAGALIAGGSNNFHTAVYRLQSANVPNWNADPNTALRVGAVTSGNFGADNTTLYFSFLMQTDNVGTGYRSLLQLTGDGGVSRITFGLPVNSTTFQILNGAAGLQNTGITATANTTYLIVGRIDYAAGNDTVRMWVNPTVGLPEGPADATMTSYNVGTFNQLSFRYDSNIMIFDEFRVGTTWESVLPVIPEPSSAALLGLVLAGLAYLRIRRKQA